LKAHNADHAGSLLVTAAVILFFASVPMGIFIVTFVHQSFYLDKSYWYFDSPMSSYFMMVSMFLIIPVLLIIIAIYLFKTYESKKRSINLIIASTITLVIMGSGVYLSLDNFYYMDKNGLYYDELWKLDKTVYSWDDITAMKQVNKNVGGTLTPEKVIFTYGDENIELPLTPKLRNEIEPVFDYIENAKGVELVMETVATE
jgi:ABC-type multidrug transport system fused ATPase/permease subunit